MRHYDIRKGEVFFIGLSRQGGKQAAALANNTRNYAIAEIQRGRKTGRIYMKGTHQNIPHRASAPGEAPATDTGTLVSNIVADEQNNGDWITGVPQFARSTPPGAGAGFGRRRLTYPARLETRMRRPWLRPAGESATGDRPIPLTYLQLKQGARAPTTRRI